jgi:hypothetical protein
MRNEEDRSDERIERTLELLDCRDVEMVRRLIQSEAVHRACREESDQRSSSLTR